MPPPALIGTYKTPRFRLGSTAFCEVRGEVIITGLSASPIPWPIGKRPGGRARALVVFGGLADAVKRESAAAVCHFWGITPQTVSKWRKTEPTKTRARRTRCRAGYNSGDRVPVGLARPGPPLSGVPRPHRRIRTVPDSHIPAPPRA
jgi:hypothetical protein